jgi:hypothetical protein
MSQEKQKDKSPIIQKEPGEKKGAILLREEFTL